MNTKMREELVSIAKRLESLKRECGDNPETPTAIHNGQLMSLSYAIREIAARASAPVNKVCHDCKTDNCEVGLNEQGICFDCVYTSREPQAVPLKELSDLEIHQALERSGLSESHGFQWVETARVAIAADRKLNGRGGS